MAHVHIATWRSDYRGFAPDDYLAALSITNEQRFYEDIIGSPETMAFVAEDRAPCVVGLSTCGPYRDEGALLDGEFSAELYNLYVAADARKSGVGRDLVRAAARGLASRGVRSMMLWTFDGYASNSFYPRLGGRIVGRRQAMIGNKRVHDLAFGWDDTLMSLL
jgi:ribosomal protein S18 acetylase RimI-like enzyme